MADSTEYKDRYGQWAGVPKGREPDFTRCAEEVHSTYGFIHHQCSRKRGHGPDNAYCKQHAKMRERSTS